MPHPVSYLEVIVQLVTVLNADHLFLAGIDRIITLYVRYTLR